MVEHGRLLRARRLLLLRRLGEGPRRTKGRSRTRCPCPSWSCRPYVLPSRPRPASRSNRPDTYQRLLQSTHDLTFETQPVHTYGSLAEVRQVHRTALKLSQRKLIAPRLWLVARIQRGGATKRKQLTSKRTLIAPDCPRFAPREDHKSLAPGQLIEFTGAGCRI